MATQAEIGRHLGVSQQVVATFLSEHAVERGPDGYDLDAIRLAWFQRLRDTSAGRVGIGDDLNLARERAKLTALQAAAQETKNRLADGELLELANVTATVISYGSRVRARLLAIPPRAAPVIAQMTSPVAVQAKLTEFVHEALAELAAMHVALGTADDGADTALGQSGKAMAGSIGPAAETDGQPVGGQIPDTLAGGQRRARKVVNGKG